MNHSPSVMCLAYVYHVPLIIHSYSEKNDFDSVRGYVNVYIYFLLVQ